MSIYIPQDTTALALGAEAVARVLQAAGVEPVRNGSRGLFWLEPLLEVDTEDGRIGFGPVTNKDIPGILDALETDASIHHLYLGQVEKIEYLASQQRLTYARAGQGDPVCLDNYQTLNGFVGLSNALQMDGQQIVDQVKDSGLRGRGGAAFPAGIKWQTVLDCDSEQKYIVCNADVDEIIVSHKTATGVRLSDDQTMDADLVVFGGDPETCYKHLLPKSRPRLPRSIKKQYSMGLYVLYFGTKKLYPDVAHHSIWMGPRFKQLLSEIFDAKHMSEDFSLYVHRPTATDKSFAPEGCESFYVLCPVPNLQGNVVWSSEGEVLRDRIVQALEETILPELSSVIEEVFWMTPEDFAKDYRSMHGAGFSIEPRLTQSAWFRFHNRDSAVSNLYFVGAGTHPGAGLPGVVSSAKVVEELLTGVEVGSGG